MNKICTSLEQSKKLIELGIDEHFFGIGLKTQKLE